MPGVGKSFIGEKLAVRLGCKFVDVDKLIEKEQGMNLQEVLDKNGEENFIEIEKKAILSLNGDRIVIAPGGSIVYSPEAMEYLKKISKIIYLKDRLNNIKKRISNLGSRGVVGLKNKSFEELFRERERLYEKYVDFVVKIENFNEEKIVEEIVKILEGMK